MLVVVSLAWLASACGGAANETPRTSVSDPSAAALAARWNDAGGALAVSPVVLEDGPAHVGQIPGFTGSWVEVEQRATGRVEMFFLHRGELVYDEANSGFGRFDRDYANARLRGGMLFLLP